MNTTQVFKTGNYLIVTNPDNYFDYPAKEVTITRSSTTSTSYAFSYNNEVFIQLDVSDMIRETLLPWDAVGFEYFRTHDTGSDSNAGDTAVIDPPTTTELETTHEEYTTTTFSELGHKGVSLLFLGDACLCNSIPVPNGYIASFEAEGIDTVGIIQITPGLNGRVIAQYFD